MNPQDFLPNAPGRPIRNKLGYWAFIPDPLPPQITWSPGLVTILGEAERSLARLAEIGSRFPNPYLMVQPFIRQEAVLSSRVEGTRTSLSELYTYEALRSSTIPDAGEVYNYVVALKYGLQRLNSLPMSLRLIRELHARLMERVQTELITPGEFRRSQNWIGPPGSTLETVLYVPPPVDVMHHALDQLEKFLHEPTDLPALVRLALIHYQFEVIHPFLDGNGRLGRLLLVLLLCEWKLLPLPLLYLSAYFEAHRLEYYNRLLGVSQRGEWHHWLEFFLTGVRDQARTAALRVHGLQTLQARYYDQLKTERDAERLMQVIDFLIGHPIVTVRQVQVGLGFSDYKIAQRYMQKLESAGILREVTGRARNRVYRVDQIMHAISAPLEYVDQ